MVQIGRRNRSKDQLESANRSVKVYYGVLIVDVTDMVRLINLIVGLVTRLIIYS
jgi:hypothetical protein